MLSTRLTTPRHGRRSARLGWLFTLFLLLGAAAAQSTPAISLSSTRLQVGDGFMLRGDRLEPESDYQLSLTGPDGAEVEETLTTSRSGALNYRTSFERPGSWQLRLSGEGLDATFSIQIDAPATAESDDEGDAADATTEAPAEGAVQPPATAGPEPGAQSEPEPETTTAQEPDAGAEQETGEETGPEPESEPVTEPGESATADEGEAGPEPDSQPAPEPAPEATPEPLPEPAPEADTTPGEEADGAAEPDEGAPTLDRPADQPEGAAPSEAEALDEGVDFALDGGDAVARRGQRELWRLAFPAESGPSNGLIEHQGNLYLAHGNSLLRLDPENGTVERRFLLPGVVLDMTPRGSDLLLSVGFDDGASERLTLSGGRLQEPVRFGADPDVFGWLRREADVEDPAARLEQDPTNPWLYLRAGQQADDTVTARRLYQQAIDRASTFFDLAWLARELVAVDQEDLADLAMDGALRDFAERGYDPNLLTDPALHEAYGFALRPLERALAAGDLDEAGFWAPWVYRLATPALPELRVALFDYAEALRGAGRRDDAALWRARAREIRQPGVSVGLDEFLGALGAVGWYAVLALLVAFFTLHLVLLFKYWIPLGVRIRQRGGSAILGRLNAIRHYSFTEKLVLVLLLALCLVFAGLWRWHDAAESVPAVVETGTLASAPAGAYLRGADLSGERGTFILAYAAHTAGALEEAQRLYEGVPSYAPAVNNLAVITGNEALYQRALELSPGLREASYNLGRITSPLPFHETYRSGQPLLAVPEPVDLQIASGNTWQARIADVFVEPWRALTVKPPVAWAPWLWTTAVVLFGLLTVATVLWLFVPRPALSRNAPRSLLYHLLALLVPGSGLADELWGLLLLAPWAIIGFDTTAKLAGWPSLGVSFRLDLWILGLLYGLNLIALVIEFVSYRRRMRALRAYDPDTARIMGMRVQDGTSRRSA